MTLTREARAHGDGAEMKPCPSERIIVVIDVCEDRPQQRFPNRDGRSPSTVGAAKKCAEAFLLNKAAMNPDHQFSLLIWKANIVTMSAFHNRVADHMKQLHGINANYPPSQPTQLSVIFQLVYDTVFKNIDDEESKLAPLRLVIFYGRPGFCVMDENVLSDYKNVTIDILYIHRPLLSAKEKNRTGDNLMQLKHCLSEKSFFAVALVDSLLTLKHTMKFLIHPNLRL